MSKLRPLVAEWVRMINRPHDVLGGHFPGFERASATGASRKALALLPGSHTPIAATPFVVRAEQL
ncbi:MAG: hypothetical protein M3Z25_22700 [Actinomycetota bacterium]|nr:hypothetical protein [Actinomycetota bacterium]